jgi:hypothetical protein
MDRSYATRQRGTIGTWLEMIRSAEQDRRRAAKCVADLTATKRVRRAIVIGD